MTIASFEVKREGAFDDLMHSQLHLGSMQSEHIKEESHVLLHAAQDELSPQVLFPIGTD